ncbi:MAG: GNAT family N-acetyltransferase [Alphaproteobacteria bacterium]|nr:GNAT family N-acetyltransferase [Alphaproteobacteria bacterium]
MIHATAAHAIVMADIHRASFPPPEAWGADAFALQIALPGVFGLLDEAGGILLARVAADEAEVLTIAVHQSARHRGIGRRLLGAARDRAGADGAATMFLEVSTANTAARALYDSAGFVAVGLRRRYYADGSDALVMRCPITSVAAPSL